MKMFFEEYGMVVVVMVVAFTLISVSTGFANTVGDEITSAWTQMVSEASNEIK